MYTNFNEISWRCGTRDQQQIIRIWCDLGHNAYTGILKRNFTIERWKFLGGGGGGGAVTNINRAARLILVTATSGIQSLSLSTVNQIVPVPRGYISSNISADSVQNFRSYRV